MNTLFVFILACAAFVPQIATASDLKDDLNRQFKDKILVLRQPAGNETLSYDAQGKPLSPDTARDWTVYGVVQIEKIELDGNKLRLQGRRLYVRREGNGLAPFEFKKPKTMKAPPVKPSVKIEISTNEPLSSTGQAQTFLGNVFALNKADLLDSVPEFWRGYLGAHLTDYDLTQGKEMDFKAVASATPTDPPAHRNTTPSSPSQEGLVPLGKIYQIGPNTTDLKPPNPIYTPEPPYTEAARYEKFQGTLLLSMVLDKAGKVRTVEVMRPLGLGLDESGVAKVKTWMFGPATLRGEPVAIEMKVEVAFNLY